MATSDTPRTDASCGCGIGGLEVVLASFARSLERENRLLRNALLESSHFWQAVAFHYGSDNHCAEAEAKSLEIRDKALRATHS